MASTQQSPVVPGLSPEAMLAQHVLPLTSLASLNEGREVEPIVKADLPSPDIMADQPPSRVSQNDATSITGSLASNRKSHNKPSGNETENSMKPRDWSKLLKKFGRGDGKKRQSLKKPTMVGSMPKIPDPQDDEESVQEETSESSESATTTPEPQSRQSPATPARQANRERVPAPRTHKPRGHVSGWHKLPAEIRFAIYEEVLVFMNPIHVHSG